MNGWKSYGQGRPVSYDLYKRERNNNYNQVILPPNDFGNRNNNDFNRNYRNDFDFQNDNGIRRINSNNIYIERNKYKVESNNNNFQKNNYRSSNQRNYMNNNYGLEKQNLYGRNEELNYNKYNNNPNENNLKNAGQLYNNNNIRRVQSANRYPRENTPNMNNNYNNKDHIIDIASNNEGYRRRAQRNPMNPNNNQELKDYRINNRPQSGNPNQIRHQRDIISYDKYSKNKYNNDKLIGDKEINNIKNVQKTRSIDHYNNNQEKPDKKFNYGDPYNPKVNLEIDNYGGNRRYNYQNNINSDPNKMGGNNNVDNRGMKGQIPYNNRNNNNNRFNERKIGDNFRQNFGIPKNPINNNNDQIRNYRIITDDHHKEKDSEKMFNKINNFNFDKNRNAPIKAKNFEEFNQLENKNKKEENKIRPNYINITNNNRNNSNNNNLNYQKPIEKENILNKYINKNPDNKPSFEEHKKQFDGLNSYINKEEQKKPLYGENKPYNYGLNQPNINKPPEKKQNAIEVNKDNKIAPKINHEISSQYRNEKNRLYNPNNIRSEGDRPRYLSEDKRNIQRLPVYQNYIQEKEKEQNRNNINQKNEAGIRVNRFHANVNQNNDNVIKKLSNENIQNKYNNGVDINNLLNTRKVLDNINQNNNQNYLTKKYEYDVKSDVTKKVIEPILNKDTYLENNFVENNKYIVNKNISKNNNNNENQLNRNIINNNRNNDRNNNNNFINNNWQKQNNINLQNNNINNNNQMNNNKGRFFSPPPNHNMKFVNQNQNVNNANGMNNNNINVQMRNKSADKILVNKNNLPNNNNFNANLGNNNFNNQFNINQNNMNRNINNAQLMNNQLNNMNRNQPIQNNNFGQFNNMNRVNNNNFKMNNNMNQQIQNNNFGQVNNMNRVNNNNFNNKNQMNNNFQNFNNNNLNAAPINNFNNNFWNNKNAMLPNNNFNNLNNRQMNFNSSPMMMMPNNNFINQFMFNNNMMMNNQAMIPAFNPKSANNNQIQVNQNAHMRSPSAPNLSRQLPTITKPCANGLQNIGATCYMNATIQCLAHVENFTKNLLRKRNEIKSNKYKNPLANAFLEVIENLWENNSITYYAPNNFKDIISKMNPLFAGIQANDSKDLVLFLLETMHNELNKVKNTNPQYDDNIDQYNFEKSFESFVKYFQRNFQSIVSDNFYGMYNSRMQCLNCKVLTHNIQCYNILIIPLEEVRKFKNRAQNNVNIRECFEYYQKLEYMVGQNQIYCNSCKQMANSANNTTLIVGPKILIINLNRGKGLQFNIKLDFTEFINIYDFIYFKNTPHKYRLIGVVTHFGPSGESGHFIAFCRSFVDKKWYRYNDAIVTPSSFKDARDVGVPYILFYQAED